ASKACSRRPLRPPPRAAGRVWSRSSWATTGYCVAPAPGFSHAPATWKPRRRDSATLRL
ncbi:MAG: hypothetical protein AVDCRST_MAG40-539, partial [uncultured Gemmatimonadaceae bacterium]